MKKILFTLITLLSSLTGICAEDTFSGNLIASEGAWCWFADPRAIHYENADKSINMSYIGYIDVHGAVKASQYDWNTGEKKDILVRSYFQPDDHNNPTFLVLPDERVLIIYSRHTDEAAFYYRVSLKPGDISQLGDEKRLATANNTTYPSPFIMSDDPDHWYMCWRGISWHPTIARLTLPDEKGDCHFDWGPYQMVQSTGARPYAKYYSNGKDKIYMSYTTGHPDNEDPNWLYFNVFNVNDKCLYDIKGNKLSTVANGKFNVNKTDDYKTKYPYTVVDAPAGGTRDWVWQIALDKNQNPRIAMVKINGAKTQHEYYYARWTGSAWALTDICNGGGKFHPSNTEYCYSGGEALDQQNPGIMYVSKPTAGTYGNVHEIWKYTINDNGVVTGSEQITRNSKKNNVRPFVLPGSQGSPLRLAWMNGDYQYWIVCQNYPNGYPTSIMCDYEWKAPEKKEVAGWTSSTLLKMNSSKYYGVLETLSNGIEYGLDQNTHRPYIKINGTRYDSQNQLYTSDAWKTCPATTDGKSYFSILDEWKLTIAYNAEKKQVTIYRNALIDQVIDVEITTTPDMSISQYLSQDEVIEMLESSALESMDIPENINTDIVLPQTVAGMGVTWSSSNPDILSETGLVKLPAKDTEVILTATTASASKLFTITVHPRNIEQNVRATISNLDLTKNTASGFSTNKYGTLPQGTLKGLRSYTVIMKVNAKSLDKQPRLYDLGGGSGNSFFLRANALSAGIKYAGGTTTMVNSSVQLTTNKEYSLAVTFDAASKITKVYLDGELVANGNANVNEPYMIYETVGDARNYIGRTQWWDSGEAANNVDFVGTIKDFTLYDIALTRKEVCNAQGLPFDPGPYTEEFVNGGFEESYSVMSGSGVSSDRAIYIPKGWTCTYDTRDANDLTALKAGDLYYSNFFAGKAKPQNAGNQTMWIRQRWGASIIDYSQNVLLPAGDYTLTAVGFATDNSSNNHAYIYVGEDLRTVTTLNAWMPMSFEFTSNGDEPIKIGCQANHVANEFICGFDNFVLTPKTPTAITTIGQDSKFTPAYNLNGQSTNSNSRGILISNGKKIMK